jgi:hypothetical protein
MTRGSARVHFNREAGSEAIEHVTALELASVGGEIRRHRTRDSAGTHLTREVRFGVIGHVTASEPTSA